MHAGFSFRPTVRPHMVVWQSKLIKTNTTFHVTKVWYNKGEGVRGSGEGTKVVDKFWRFQTYQQNQRVGIAVKEIESLSGN